MIEKIVKLIVDKGYTQESLEVAAHLPKGRISKWKDGKGEPTGSQIWRMSRILDVPVVYLLDDSIDEPMVGNTDAERTALDLVRGLRLPKDEVIRRLAKEPTPRVTPEIVPKKPVDLSPPSPRAGRGKNRPAG